MQMAKVVPVDSIVTSYIYGLTHETSSQIRNLLKQSLSVIPLDKTVKFPFTFTNVIIVPAKIARDCLFFAAIIFWARFHLRLPSL